MEWPRRLLDGDIGVLWVGIIAGSLAGGLVGLLLGVFAITYLVDQIIMGVVLNVFVSGLTGYLYDKPTPDAARLALQALEGRPPAAPPTV